MQYRKLGDTDLDVSVIGLGANNFGNPQRITDHAASKRVIDACLDVGVNFIDTANIYGGGQSEVHIGEALKGKRDQALIATKFNLDALADGESPRDRIARNVEESLGKLQTDVIDLYQIHFIPHGVPHEEYLGPLNDLVTEGKVRYVGECNYSGWRHADANRAAAAAGYAPFVSSQNYYNVMRRQVELELLPYCTEHNVGFLPYFPLAGGWLTGKYAPGADAPSSARSMVGKLQGDDRAHAVLAQLDAYANEHGRTLLDLAFAWLLAHPAVSSVIAGAMTPEQVASNAAACEWTLSREQRDAIDAIASWDGTSEEIERFGMTSGPKSPAR